MSEPCGYLVMLKLGHQFQKWSSVVNQGAFCNVSLMFSFTSLNFTLALVRLSFKTTSAYHRDCFLMNVSDGVKLTDIPVGHQDIFVVGIMANFSAVNCSKRKSNRSRLGSVVV
jgi:hypothetical protein